MTDYAKLDAWIDAHFDEEVRFLQQLVRVPTDTPPGNNAPHAERTAELLAALHQDVGHFLRLLHRRLDPVQPQEIGDLLDVVDDVVELGGEVVDVLAVERGDERRLHSLDDVVGDPVALLLGLEDVAREPTVVGPLVEHLLEQPCGAQGVFPRLDEEVEEGAVARD